MGTIPHAFERLNVYPGRLPNAQTLTHDDSVGRFYLRLSVQDKPGVLASITEVFEEAGVSIQGFRQQETDEGAKEVPIVITTHATQRQNVARAAAEIDKLPEVNKPTVIWPIFDRPEEFGE
ncbi:MAG: ACT domain-containing protein [Tepidisphaeraceae bacterium]